MSSLFMLDTAGNQELLKHETLHTSTLGAAKAGKRRLLEEQIHTPLRTATAPCVGGDDDDNDDDEDEEDDGDYFGLPPPSVDLSKLIDETLALTVRQPTKLEQELSYASEAVDAAVARAKANPKSKRKRVINLDYSDFNAMTGKFDEERLARTDVAKEMATSDIPLGLEQLKELPSLTKKKQRDLNRVERSKTKGKGWYNLPATEMTEEVENDLKILQMRSVLDPKHFYKKNDLKVLPKYFQLGTVQHSALDHYSERNTRKNKKKSLVDELLADTEAQAFTKRKYKEIMVRRDKYAHRKAMQKMKKLKKNKK